MSPPPPTGPATGPSRGASALDVAAGPLFAELFYGLRQAGVQVGLGEWMTLMRALASGTVRPELTDFYYVARAVLVKSETQFDTWDQVFAAVFGGAEMPTKLARELLDWLADPIARLQLSPEELAAMERLPLERLRALFEQRLREQRERHDGGDRWVGTGGRSPFGHGGANPAGVRVGGAGGGRSAIQVAMARQFAAYRDDRVLDTRALAVALKKLRRLERKHGEPELDIDETIAATGRNAGELELVLRPPRKNQARVLLLMDVGGSMDPYIDVVERLFSAASGLGHWRKFEALSFHNCPYETLFPKEYGDDAVPTADVLRERPAETFLIFVGDASMAPSELTHAGGAIYYWHSNGTPGIEWLHRLRSRFHRAVWLNPMPPRWWGGWSTRVIRQLYPMFPLTVRGLEDAVNHLVRGRDSPAPALDPTLLRG